MELFRYFRLSQQTLSATGRQQTLSATLMWAEHATQTQKEEFMIVRHYQSTEAFSTLFFLMCKTQIKNIMIDMFFFPPNEGKFILYWVQ